MTLLLCAIVIVMVKFRDSVVRTLVCSTYVSFSFLICKMGCDLPPRAVIWTGNKEILEKHLHTRRLQYTGAVRQMRIAVGYNLLLASGEETLDLYLGFVLCRGNVISNQRQC